MEEKKNYSTYSMVVRYWYLVPYHHHTTLGDVGPSTTTNTNITVGHGAEFSIHLSCSNLFIHLKLGQGEV